MARGQVAMEYLVTYGWAILGLVVAIGALAYFGVLDPSMFIPERCSVPVEFGCEEFKLAPPDNAPGTPEAHLILRNNLDRPITLQQDSRRIACDGCPDGQRLCPDDCVGVGVTNCGAIVYQGTTYLGDADVTIGPGDQFEWVSGDDGPACLGFTEGAKERIRFEFNYTKRAGGYQHIAEGELRAEVDS